jgi:hypothetical protein
MKARSKKPVNHSYRCQKCGGMVDRRQLDDVLFHEDHKQRPDIPYSGGSALIDSEPYREWSDENGLGDPLRGDPRFEKIVASLAPKQ